MKIKFVHIKIDTINYYVCTVHQFTVIIVIILKLL
jgi:hypothetical protein